MRELNLRNTLLSSLADIMKIAGQLKLLEKLNIRSHVLFSQASFRSSEATKEIVVVSKALYLESEGPWFKPFYPSLLVQS